MSKLDSDIELFADAVNSVWTEAAQEDREPTELLEFLRMLNLFSGTSLLNCPLSFAQ